MFLSSETHTHQGYAVLPNSCRQSSRWLWLHDLGSLPVSLYISISLTHTQEYKGDFFFFLVNTTEINTKKLNPFLICLPPSFHACVCTCVCVCDWKNNYLQRPVLWVRVSKGSTVQCLNPGVFHPSAVCLRFTSVSSLLSNSVIDGPANISPVLLTIKVHISQRAPADV